MSQNSARLSWTFEEVDAKLKDIMENIFRTVSDTAMEYGLGKNYMAGANIAGFIKVADSMIDQGIVCLLYTSHTIIICRRMVLLPG